MTAALKLNNELDVPVELADVYCTFITNLQLLYFMSGWELLGWHDNAKKSLQKLVIFYQVVLKTR